MKILLLIFYLIPLCLFGQKFQLIVESKQYQVPVGLEFVGKIHILCEGNCFYTVDSISTNKGNIVQNDKKEYEIHIPAETSKSYQSSEAEYKLRAIMRVNNERIAVDMKGTFQIVRPGIVFYSANISYLYRNCVNILHFSVPPFWEERQLSVTGSSNLNFGNCSIGGYSIVPKGPDVKATITIKKWSKEKVLEIGTITFGVIDPPPPEMFFYANGKRVQSGDSVSVNDSITFAIIPNKAFEFELPQDARYGIKKMEVFEKEEGKLPLSLAVFEDKENKIISLSYPGYDLAFLDKSLEKEKPQIESGDEWGFGDNDSLSLALKAEESAQIKKRINELTFMIPKSTNNAKRIFIFTTPEIYRRNGYGQLIKEELPPQKFILYEKR